MPVAAFINGPPGSGKTSLCKKLQETHGYVHIATGDLLRENIKKRTEAGRVAKKCISDRSLIPDEVVISMVKSRTSQPDCVNNGFILDGFPRTTEQALLLDEKNISPTSVIILSLPEEECINRILGRRMDPVSGAIYHVTHVLPPPDNNNEVLRRLKHRPDDVLSALTPRMEAYVQYGHKINKFFQDIATTVSAEGNNVDAVFQKVKKILEPPVVESATVKAEPEQQEQQQQPVNNNPTTVSMEEEQLDRAIDATKILDDETAEHLMNIIGSEGEDSEIDPIEDFQRQIIAGVHVIKHGRQGKPHVRTIFCDNEITRVYWQKVGANNRYKVINREQSIELAQVTSIATGRESDVMKRSGEKDKAERYFSLVTPWRTLDIEGNSPEHAAFLVNGFKSILSNNNQ